ncbi:MAG TPA: hypothetical protein VK195_05835 [Burkholderiaceae bacterium]|nr:hypothetical protein [Burkholderiaceae bacterium]
MSQLVIVGVSQIASDLVDCALELGWSVSRVLVDEMPEPGARDLTWDERLTQWRTLGVAPELTPLEDYEPQPGEQLILGPTTPLRYRLVQRLEARHGGALKWARLVHPAASVSRLAQLAEGCFVGAGAVIAPGVRLGEHVFVNRSVSLGHDCRIDSFTRIQPGATLGGLIQVGRAATVGLGARVVERLVLGEQCFVGAASLVKDDVAPLSMVAGVPARHVKTMESMFEP